MSTTTPASVAVGGERYAEVLTFLYREARLLDEARFEEWLELLDDEVAYDMPVRLTRMPKDGPGFEPEMGFFAENRSSLVTRVKRLQTEQAWAEQPGSRTRHFVSNLLVERREREDELLARSSFLVTRTRSDLPYDLFTGERLDVLRTGADGLRLAARTILLDQTVLKSYNLSIFF